MQPKNTPTTQNNFPIIKALPITYTIYAHIFPFLFSAILISAIPKWPILHDLALTQDQRYPIPPCPYATERHTHYTKYVSFEQSIAHYPYDTRINFSFSIFRAILFSALPKWSILHDLALTQDQRYPIPPCPYATERRTHYAKYVSYK